MLERKAVCKPATKRREETNAQMIALVKGSRAKRSRAKPFNDWAVPAYITVQSLFLQNSFDFQKSATFKGLKSSPRMYTDVSFNLENGAFSRMEK